MNDIPEEVIGLILEYLDFNTIYKINFKINKTWFKSFLNYISSTTTLFIDYNEKKGDISKLLRGLKKQKKTIIQSVDKKENSKYFSKLKDISFYISKPPSPFEFPQKFSNKNEVNVIIKGTFLNKKTSGVWAFNFLNLHTFQYHFNPRWNPHNKIVHNSLNNRWMQEEISKNLFQNQIGPFELEFKFDKKFITSFLNGEKGHDFKYRNLQNNVISSSSFGGDDSGSIKLESIIVNYSYKNFFEL